MKQTNTVTSFGVRILVLAVALGLLSIGMLAKPAPASAKEPRWVKIVLAQEAGHCYFSSKKAVPEARLCSDPSHNMETYYVGTVKYPKKSTKKQRITRSQNKCHKVWAKLGGPSATPATKNFLVATVGAGGNKKQYRYMGNNLICSLIGNWKQAKPRKNTKKAPKRLGAGWHAPGVQTQVDPA